MNQIKQLALDNGRDFHDWPEADRRDAAAALYTAPDGDDRMLEACESWVEHYQQAAVLALMMPDREMGRRSLGTTLDACLLTYAGVLIQQQLDENYNEWLTTDLAEKDRDYKGGIR